MLLASHFLERFAAQYGRRIRGFSDAAIAAIRLSTWEGNVRELMGAVRRAVIMVDGGKIEPRDLGLDTEDTAAAATAEPETLDLREARRRSERDVLLRALAKSKNNVAAVARMLGVSRPKIYHLLSAHGIDWTEDATDSRAVEGINMKTRISLAGLAGVSLLCLMTATAHGAAPAPVATDKVDEAKQQAEVRGELRAAIISARNDVKTSPASVDAHEKLGQLLLRSGDGVGAEKEARAMRDNGADPTRWAPILSRGFAMQGVPERTLREVRADGLQGAARGAALAALADAKISLKRYDEAARDLKEAEDLQPAAAEPRIATARLYPDHQPSGRGADQAARSR